MNTCFRIRELRRRSGITQAQLAASLGLRSSSTITMWETGDRNPSSSILPRLADALGCTIDELYERDSPSQLERAAPVHEKSSWAAKKTPRQVLTTPDRASDLLQPTKGHSWIISHPPAG